MDMPVTQRRAAAVALVAIAALVVSLVAVIGVGPADAAKKRPTTVRGWSTSTVEARPGQVVRFTVAVRSKGGKAGRTVRLQGLAGSTWRTLDTERSNRRGAVTLTATAGRPKVSRLRVVVAPKARAGKLVTASRAVRVRSTSPSPTASPTGSPTSSPSASPTGSPTGSPGGLPTGLPSGFPTSPPSGSPSGLPSGFPTGLPSGIPTSLPSGSSSAAPTGPPSTLPSLPGVPGLTALPLPMA